MTQPRRGRPGHDQAAVLQTAIELFNRRGYEGTSMGDLAAALGVTKAAIYHHVPSKEHLLAQALDEALDELDALVTDAASAPGTAYERLRAVVRGAVDVLVAHQPAVTLLLRVRGNSPVELAALRRRREVDTRLADLVRAAAAEGSVRTDLDPELVSRLVFGTVNSLVEWHRPGGELTPDALAEAVSTVVFDGLHAGAGREL
ncbi:TetR family transcriptional regulator [Nocardioides sp. dk4132]|uniref:TetR/AcrR family transcriptional regulator n=1 Tax=unclassified Nocardioides TaxID=2615069 RepID=UPI001296C6EB|nr:MULTISPECIES: TetR/AcrR family transcriptional regulator [unclassified Nocardioides]MQW74317.1 TetR family transcriptional regulator [Nocardioides sp. dk4132]QGA06268.1 TetR family transcriptional regulator [Nocardioides sp. dk884]